MHVARKVVLSEEANRRAIERFRAVIHARSQNMSAVREAIVRAALAYDGHFSVEDLVAVLRKKGVARAHMATIYRAVPLLVEAGIIEPALVSRGDRQLYEVVFEQEHHDHLVCSACGTVVEFRSDALEALQREIAERYGFTLDEHVMELKGRCSSCRPEATHRPSN